MRLPPKLHLVLRFVVGTVVIAVSVAIMFFLKATRPVPPVNPGGPARPQVMVLEVRPVPVQRQWTGFGTAEATDAADVPARVASTVIELAPAAREGTLVERGELLVELDPTDFQFRVDVATETITDLEAQLKRLEVERLSWIERQGLADEAAELAQAEYDRVIEAMRKNAANQREVDASRQSMINAIRDQVAVGEEIEKLDPRENEPRGAEGCAGGGGSATRRRRWSAARSGARCVGCCRTSTWRWARTSAPAPVSPASSASSASRCPCGCLLLRAATCRSVIRSGCARQVRCSTSGTRWSRGSRRRTTRSTRTMTVYVEVEGDDRPAPGAFLEGVVVSGEMANRWVVPRRSVRNDRILVVRDGVIFSMAIDTDYHVEGRVGLGVDDEQWVVIRSGLEAGDQLVLNAAPSLLDGMLVEPVLVQPTVAQREPAP